MPANVIIIETVMLRLYPPPKTLAAADSFDDYSHNDYIDTDYIDF